MKWRLWFLCGVFAAAPVLAETSASGLLAEAESFYSGQTGRIDEPRARKLFEQAAAAGDPRAQVRLATLIHLKKLGFEANAARVSELLAAGEGPVEALASANDPVALSLLGLLELVGIERPANPVAARRLLERSAEGFPLWSYHNLGWIYQSGQGVAADPLRAADYYRRAAEVGNVSSMVDLGRLILQDDRTRPLGEEVRWWRIAAERGHVDARLLLGDRLLTAPVASPEDRREAVRWLEAAATSGRARARYYLAAALALGRGTNRDLPRARRLFTELADEGDLYAHNQAAWMELAGLGGPADPRQGMARLDHAANLGRDGLFGLLGTSDDLPGERSFFDQGLANLDRQARAGDPVAQALLSQFYLEGQFWLEPDPRRALEWAEKAAAKGQPKAMRVLARAHRRGLAGLEPDIVRAVHWYRRAAEGGESYCMMWLSQVLFAGSAGSPRPAEALEWLRRSGKAGNYFAIVDLGRLYDEGWHGITPDRVEATRWKQRAAELGDIEARGWLKIHAPTLATQTRRR